MKKENIFKNELENLFILQQQSIQSLEKEILKRIHNYFEIKSGSSVSVLESLKLNREKILYSCKNYNEQHHFINTILEEVYNALLEFDPKKNFLAKDLKDIDKHIISLNKIIINLENKGVSDLGIYGISDSLKSEIKSRCDFLSIDFKDFSFELSSSDSDIYKVEGIEREILESKIKYSFIFRLEKKLGCCSDSVLASIYSIIFKDDTITTDQIKSERSRWKKKKSNKND